MRGRDNGKKKMGKKSVKGLNPKFRYRLMLCKIIGVI